MTPETQEQSTQDVHVEDRPVSLKEDRQATLPAMRKRRANREQRRADLTAELTNAQQLLQQSAAEWEQAKRDHREGGTTSATDVAELGRQVKARREDAAQIEEALQEVMAESIEIATAISAEEHRLLVKRHEKEADPLRQEADQLTEAFITAVLVAPREILRKRKALAEQVAQKFPRATQIAPADLDELAVRIRSRWSGPEAQQLQMGGAHRELRAWVSRLLAGPLASPAAISRVLKEAGIKE